MPQLLDPFPEEDFHAAAGAITFTEYTVIGDCQAFPDGQIVASGVNQKPDHTAYWLRPRDNGQMMAAFLICKPISLPGLEGTEAIRGWVHEQAQNKGVFVELMTAAAAGGLLVSDEEGMTEASYTSWIRARGFSKRLYDVTTRTFHEVSEIPRDVHFPKAFAGQLWRLVLQLES
jgi:hypothetical protein